MARVFFSGDTRLMEHGSSFGLLTQNGCKAMAADQRPDGASAQLPRVDGELYRKLRSKVA
jgi:hypothetical protein